VASLPAIQRDPFARLLAAQAVSEPMWLLTTDKILAGDGEIVAVVWPRSPIRACLCPVSLV